MMVTAEPVLSARSGAQNLPLFTWDLHAYPVR